ncbi:antirepressor protein [Vibrio phage 1.275.O._10N.286.54.E11]|nr:antirepressor protein [Vibrio phage 1.275.O._10N.286.54.E11]
MNQLITSNQPLTMSTREIAKLLDKQHSHIKVSAERLSEKGTIALRGSKFEHNGNIYEEYLLEKRDCLILVAQNCPEFTAAIVDRWQLLEEAQKPQLPQSFAEALQLAANQAKMLEEASPKVEFHDKLVNDAATFSFRDAAKKIQQRPNKFTEWLRLEGYICKNNMPKQQCINQGLFKTHTGTSKEEFQFSQTRVTSKGLSYFTAKLGETIL